MLFLPAAALCCLGSALVAMAAQLVQDDLTLTRRLGGSVSFSCGATHQCMSYYVYWYQKKDSGAFRRILGIDEPVLKPVVSVFPAASRGLEGSSSLLCLASHMFPPRLRFSWKVQKEEDGSWAELGPEGEQLKLEESGRSSSILLLRPQSGTVKCRCEVEHEGGTVEAHTAQVVSPPLMLASVQQQVKLLCVVSTVLIVKSLVYCWGLCAEDAQEQ